MIGFYPVKTSLINPGADLIAMLLKNAHKQGLEIQDNDILVIASKVVSYQQGRVISFQEVKPSKKAIALSKKYGIHAGRIEVYLREADRAFGGIYFQKPHYLLFFTLKNGVLSGNAGVDVKNCPPGCCSLQVLEPQKTAERLCGEVLRRTGKKVGVIIADTEFSPLRLGGIGIAIGVAGFNPVKNWVGRKDIYGEASIPLARSNMADPIAAMATNLFGEGGDQVPFVLVRNANVEFSEEAKASSLALAPEDDPLITVFQPTKKIHVSYDWDRRLPPMGKRK